MHHFHKFLEYGSLAIIALILILAGSLLWNFQSTKADVSSGYQLMGWIWSPNYSWISLNSANCIGNSSCGSVSANPYAVVMSSNTDEIYGWGWSSYVGWVCFGKTCASSNICNSQTGCVPDNYGSLAPSGGWKISVDNSVVSGTAKILSLGDEGWISFDGGATTTPNQTSLPACYNCTPHCEVTRTSTDGVTQECIAFSTSTYDGCKICFSTDKFNEIPQPVSTPLETVEGGSGKISFGCNGPSSCTTLVSGGAKRVACNNNCSSTYSFGSGIDLGNSGALLGWAWNGNVDRNVGAGWFHLNADEGNAGILFPWLETDYGSIYGQKAIRQKGISRANATYCIFAKDIIGVTPGVCDVSSVNLAFPVSSSTNVYRNALGKLDVKGLESFLVCKSGICYNKYGNKLPATTTSLTGTIKLENEVRRSEGDLVIGPGLQFNNGDKYGNGTIIVNGNLYIDNNFSYSPGTTDDLNKLASIAWIVKGDVIIDPSVTSTVGAFIVLGNNSSTCLHENEVACSLETISYPKYKQNGYGVIFSGTSSKPFTTYGLMVAKAFDFRRTYADPIQGAERIIYDGRIIANPPPGFKGFVEGLPVMKDF